MGTMWDFVLSARRSQSTGVMCFDCFERITLIATWEGLTVSQARDGAGMDQRGKGGREKQSDSDVF